MKIILRIAFLACLVPSTLQAAELDKIKSYLSSFDTLSADFIQEDENGEKRTGKIYISRPGLARWEYNAPGKSMIIVNKDDLMHYDFELDQVAYDSLPPSPLTILLDRKVNLEKGTSFEGLKQDKEKELAVFKGKPSENAEEEKLVLSFSKNPYKLSELWRIDSNGIATRLILSNLVLDAKLDNALFSIANPEKKDKVTKR